MTFKLRIAISACLIGQPVRYDGQDKHQAWLEHIHHVDWIPICPEVEAGMSVPREKIQVELADGKLKLMAIESRQDWSETMDDVANRWITQLQKQQVSGYVFKSRSPSCGLQGVPLYEADGSLVEKQVQGRFAQRVNECMPGLPLIEETQMSVEVSRHEFLIRAWQFHRNCHSD